MRVGFDLDGVLYNFGDSVRAYLNSIGREYGWKDDADEPHHWNFFEYWGMDRHEFKQICDDGADAGYVFCGPAREGAAEAVQRVFADGHEVVIITDRQFGSTPEVSHKNTTDWLAQHDIPYDELVFSADKTCVQTDLFVEDKLENYDALIKNGTIAYLINRPWNMIEGGDARRRIDSVTDYVDIVESIASLGYADLTFG